MTLHNRFAALSLVASLSVPFVTNCGGTVSGGDEAQEVEEVNGVDAGPDAPPPECPDERPQWYEPWSECLECVYYWDCESGTCAGGHCLD